MIPDSQTIEHQNDISSFGIKVRKAAKIRNQYNQVPHLTQDTTWESDKYTIKHHKLIQSSAKKFQIGMTYETILICGHTAK